MAGAVIYYIEQVDGIGEEELRELLPFLSPERREKVGRYRFPKDRVQSILAWLLLRYGLGKLHGIKQPPRIETDPQGKPFLPEYPHIHFNLSHCEKAVACGFSSEALGVDVQHLVPYKEALAKFFMTPSERKSALLGAPDREFTRMWTLKEAYGKYTGEGICYPMSEKALTEGYTAEGCILQSYGLNGFYLSSCTREEQSVVKITLSQLREFYSSLPWKGDCL